MTRRSNVWILSLAFLLLLAWPACTGAQELEDTEPSVGSEGGHPLGAPAPETLLKDQPGTPLPAALLPLKSSSIDKRFEGFGFDDNITESGGFVFIPPDAIGAAGKSRVVAVVNTMIETRTKSGKLKWRDSLRDFFAPLAPMTFTFDPKVVYDHYEDRFVVVTLERVFSGLPIDPGNVSRILVAVSKDGNPKTGTAADWNYHLIPSKVLFLGFVELWADYPGFEVDEEAVYITANMFAVPPFAGLGGVRLWIVDKGAGAGGFYDGGAAGVTIHDPYAGGGIATTTMPALVFGSDGDSDSGADSDSGSDSDTDDAATGVGGAGSTLGTFLVSYSGLTFGGPGGLEVLQVVTVDDPLGKIGGPFFSQQFVGLGDIEDVGGVFGFPPLPDCPQLGTTVPIEVNDRRALDAVWRSDRLWVTTTITPNSGSEVGQTTAHWIELDTTGSPLAPIVVTDQGDIGGEDIAPGACTFFPAVAVNKNQAAKFGFSASAPSIYAGAFATGRAAGDVPGTVRASEVVKAGEDFYIRTFGGPRNRWGDYSGAAVDPADDETFWIFNEFADTRGTRTGGGEDGRWGTAWARCELDDDSDSDSD